MTLTKWEQEAHRRPQNMNRYYGVAEPVAVTCLGCGEEYPSVGAWGEPDKHPLGCPARYLRPSWIEGLEGPASPRQEFRESRYLQGPR